VITGFACAVPDSATITLHVDQPGIRISPTLYVLSFKTAPAESTIPLSIGGTNEFKHIFPPHSVTILKLQQ
jgi:hypothetical protein